MHPRCTDRFSILADGNSTIIVTIRPLTAQAIENRLLTVDLFRRTLLLMYSIDYSFTWIINRMPTHIHSHYTPSLIQRLNFRSERQKLRRLRLLAVIFLHERK